MAPSLCYWRVIPGAILSSKLRSTQALLFTCVLSRIAQAILKESPGSRSGQRFLIGDDGTIANLGQKSLNLTDDEHDLCSVFQIAAVTRPLMSVGKICDEGHNITLDASQAVVRGKGGAEVCKFHRTSGGLYVAKMRPRNTAVFLRQE